MYQQLILDFQQLHPLFFVLLGLLLLFVMVQMYYYVRYFAAPIRNANRDEKGQLDHIGTRPPVSVIISSQNEAEHLQQFLPAILSQNYPKYEVIVVNDGSTDESSNVINSLSQKYAHLKQTFLPQKAKYMSRRKMCLSIGIKAAQYEHIMLVDADCQPVSKDWLNVIMRNYTPNTEVVLGYSRFLNSTSALMDFDNLFFTMQYMGYALCGNPFRGTIRNMSYLKSTYDRVQGYSRYLNMETGEDDIFIHDMANGENVRIDTSSSAAVECDRLMTPKTYRIMKEQRQDNMRFYDTSIRLSLRMQVFSMYMVYLLALVSVVAFLLMQSWIALGSSIALFLTRMITQQVVTYKMAGKLSMKRHQLASIAFELYLPLYELHLRTFGRVGRKKWEMWKA